MPIRRERRRLYPADWDRISFRIRAIRAGWRCEWIGSDGRRCEAIQGKPNPRTGSTVYLAAAHLDHDETGVTLQLNAIFPPFMPIAAPNHDT